jgi:hypothetical protein
MRQDTEIKLGLSYNFFLFKTSVLNNKNIRESKNASTIAGTYFSKA